MANAALFLPLGLAITGGVVYVDNGLQAIGMFIDSLLLQKNAIYQEVATSQTN